MLLNTALCVLLSASVVSARTPDRPCEDADIDCASKDNEYNICNHPIDAAAYCPKYCNKCQDQPGNIECHDFDALCTNLANSEYCAKDIAYEICPKSCGLCGKSPTTTMAAPVETTQAEKETTGESGTTIDNNFIRIPDPNCQDIDPDCLQLLQVHFCADEPLVIKLCRRSCNQCPTILVPVNGTTSPPVMNTGTGMTNPSTEPVTRACQDYDSVCTLSATLNKCGTDDIISRLCPLSCGTCTAPSTEAVTNDMTSPDLNPFTPDPNNCYDNDADCATLVQNQVCTPTSIITRLCPVSCGICTNTASTVSSGVTNVMPPCEDFSVDCYRLQPSCSFDALVVRLCRVTCGDCQGPTNAQGITDSTQQPAQESTMGDTTEIEMSTQGFEPSTQEEQTTLAPITPRPNTTPLPTLPSFTLAPNQVCEDLDSQCAQLIESFYCATNDLLRSLCPLSCKTCVRTTPSGQQQGSTVTPNPDTCQDIDPQCSILANYCDIPQLLVNRLCRKTCGTCGQNISIPQNPDPLPLTCRVCVDPFCNQQVESITQCPDEAPYCSSRILNNKDGTYGLTKRCASKSDCDRGYAGTAAGSQSLCASFNSSVVVLQEFICFFCCVNNECNRHAKPDPYTLYTKN